MRKGIPNLAANRTLRLRLTTAVLTGMIVGSLCQRGAVASIPTQAGNAITISSVYRTGGMVSMTGAVSYGPVSFPPLAQDAKGDDLLGGRANLGGDLTEFSMNFEGEYLFLRWKVNLAPWPLGAAPGHVYGATFAVNGQTAYEVNVARLSTHQSPWGPRAGIWRCGSVDNCDIRHGDANNPTPFVYPMLDGYVTVRIGRRILPGDRITPISLGQGSVFVGVGAFAMPSGQPQIDGVQDSVRTYLPYANDWIEGGFETFTAGLRVDAAVGEPGLDATTLQYGTRATVDTDNSFSVSAPAGPEEAIYLRACHATICFYASADVPV